MSPRLPPPTPETSSWPLTVGLLALILISGCDGCRGGGDDGSEDGSAPQTEFTFGGAKPMPLGPSPIESGIKPGHWFSLTESIRSNRDDQRGVLRHTVEVSSAMSSGLGSDESFGDQREPEIDRLTVSSERGAVLPRLQTRRLDARLPAILPARYASDARAFINGHFLSATSSIAIETGRGPVNLLAPQEYFFVILTNRPERFSSLQTADWVRDRGGDDSLLTESPTHFRLVFPQGNGVLPLSETMLDWTSTAVLLWDDLEPSALTSQQWRAIDDWVHFGGRMIVNGPAGGIELNRTEPAPRLPIDVQTIAELDPQAVEGLLRTWTVEGDDTLEQQIALANQRTGRLSAEGPPRTAAASLRGCEELVWSRPTGRGRVVLTRFDLTADWLMGWRSRDSFFNAVLLGRPGRKHSATATAARVPPAIVSPDGSSPIDGARLPFDGASMNTSFRLLARDGRLPSTDPDPAMTVDEFLSHPIQGLGGWRDDSDFATLALQTLREQAGVTIPPRGFVSRSLAIYLVILVPLNYLLFWSIGRLEWAWLAVPLIGFVGALWIARQASLDLGFARSRTEISLLEIHGDHPRGHLTRFGSLYNSLSRRYDISFDSPDAAILPLGALGQVRVDAEEQRPATLRHGYGPGPILGAFTVASNRARLFHAEQVIDLGGAIRLDNELLRNDSRFDLRDAWLIQKDGDGEVSVAAIGDCDAGTNHRPRWRTGRDAAVPADLPLDIDRLLTPLVQTTAWPRGSARLIARCEQPLPGMAIDPEPPQTDVAAAVLVHLRMPPQTIGDGDLNLPPEPTEDPLDTP